MILDQIGALIAKDKLKQAIEKMQDVLKDSELLSEVIVQSARHNDVMKQIRLGTINLADADITRNKIRFALIQMVNEMEEEAKANENISAEIERVSSLHQQINVENSKNVNTGNVNTGGGNFHIGDSN